MNDAFPILYDSLFTRRVIHVYVDIGKLKREGGKLRREALWRTRNRDLQIQRP